MPSSSSHVARLLAELARALRELDVRWYLFGAQASIVYGAARLTADVDVTLDPGETPRSELLAALGRHGFDPDIDDPQFVEVTRVIPMLHRRSGLPVDLVLAGPGLEDLFFERVRRLKIGRTSIPVAAPEDIISMKILSGRPRDLDDVEMLLSTRGGELDMNTIRETLALAQAMLDQSDLLPALESLVKRSRGRPAERASSTSPRKTRRPGKRKKK